MGMRDYDYEQRVLPLILEDKAASLGDALFVVGDAELSYAGALERTRRLGGGLRLLGVGQGDRVLTMLPNTIEAVVAFLGIAWIGAIGVPVNTGYRGDLLRYILADADADVLVVHDSYLDRIREVVGEVPSIRHLVVVGTAPDAIHGRTVHAWADVAAAAPVDRADVGPGDLQAIMYTSGTTGASKGVMVTYHHAYQYANPLGCNFYLEGDVVYVTLPLFHIGGQWQGIYSSLLVEGRAVLKRKYSVREFWDDVDRYGVTQTTLLGVMAEFLWKQPPREDDAAHSLARVTLVPAPEDPDGFSARFGVRLQAGWGLTETGCVTRPGPQDGPPPDVTTCGWVREDMFELQLIDDDDLPVPMGTPGEAVVRSKQPFALMAGYWRKPEATVEAWRNLWLHTGDVLVQHRDGSYSFVDRKKDCIRRRGENISSLEVETAVLSHPDVMEVAAIPARGEHSEDEVMVVLALRPGAELEPAALVEHLRPRMPAFMLPRFVEIRAELPKTQTQKVRKDVLRAQGPGAATWDRESTAERQSA